MRAAFRRSRSRLEETGQRIRQILSAITAPEEAAAVRGDLFQAFQDVALVPDVLIHEGALTSLMDTLPVYVCLQASALSEPATAR